MVTMSRTQKKVFDAVVELSGPERKLVRGTSLGPLIPGMAGPNIAQALMALCSYGHLERVSKVRTPIVVKILLTDEQIAGITIRSFNELQSDNYAHRRSFRMTKRISREELAERYKGRRYEDHDFKASPEYLPAYVPSRGGHEAFSSSAAAMAMEG